MPIMNNSGGGGSSEVLYLNKWKCFGSAQTFKNVIPAGYKYRINEGAWVTAPTGGVASGTLSLAVGDTLEIAMPTPPTYDASTFLPIGFPNGGGGS
jgi:hypothetical protein